MSFHMLHKRLNSKTLKIAKVTRKFVLKKVKTHVT